MSRGGLSANEKEGKMHQMIMVLIVVTTVHINQPGSNTTPAQSVTALPGTLGQVRPPTSVPGTLQPGPENMNPTPGGQRALAWTGHLEWQEVVSLVL